MQAYLSKEGKPIPTSRLLSIADIFSISDPFSTLINQYLLFNSYSQTGLAAPNNQSADRMI
jgi:hypothetical protein